MASKSLRSTARRTAMARWNLKITVSWTAFEKESMADLLYKEARASYPREIHIGSSIDRKLGEAQLAAGDQELRERQRN